MGNATVGVLLSFVVIVAASSSPLHGAETTAHLGVAELVARLSWDTVDYDHIAMTSWPKPVGSAAERLIEIGKPATPALLAAFRDPKRAVAAHLVLCRIWFPRRLFSGEEPLYRGKEVVGLRYHVRDLVWSISSDDESVLDTDSVKLALNAWCRHIPGQLRAEVCEHAG